MDNKTFISTQLINKSFKLTNYYQLGYFLFGPVLLEFTRRLIVRLSNDNDIQQLLFISREGYLLQQLYNLLTRQLLPVKNIDNIYFLSSRRAITVANVKTVSDINDILEYPYRGSYRELMINRFSITSVDENDLANIELPTNKAIVATRILNQFSKDILNIADRERLGYLKYINKFNISKHSTLGLVDFGYSGTVQKYLQRLLPVNHIRGYYCITNNRNVNDSVGLLINHGNKKSTQDAIYKYNLLFESVLTSNNNQLLYFDVDGIPVYSERNLHDCNKIIQIHKGILDYSYNIVSTCSNYFMQNETTNDLLNAWLEYFITTKNIISNDIIDVFEFQDEYSNLFTGNAFKDCYRFINL